MRSYTNLEGEKVKVSEEELIRIVELKRNLQMSSPSHKCNWRKLVEMAESEGIYCTEASENFRCLVKSFQSSIGELPSVEKHADLVADKKLDSIKEAVGDLYFEKRSVQLENQKLNKLKRDLTLYGVVAEQVHDALINQLDMEIPRWAYMGRVYSCKNKMVVFLSDLHVGAVVVNVDGNSYNFDIAQKRLKKFIDRIIEIAEFHEVTDIDVVSLGDLTEGVAMRKLSQSFEAEFSLSEQIVKAFELVRNFVVNLTQFFNVTYRGVCGNHERFYDKGENIDGDSTTYIINYMIKLFAESANLPRFEYYESDDINYSAVLDVNGKLIKSVHGDNEKGNAKIASHMAHDKAVYDVLAIGHLHHYEVKETGRGQFEAYFGSLMGANNYGKKGKFSSNASQGLIIVHEDGEIDIRRVDLQVN